METYRPIKFRAVLNYKGKDEKENSYFIDWDNYRQELEAVTKKTGVTNFNYNNNKQLLSSIKYFVNKDEEELYRIFIYTAPPLSQGDIEEELNRRNISEETKNNVKQKYNDNKTKYDSIYNKARKFIDTISLEEYVALRKGILKISNVCEDGTISINQKQVDMLIGLDIAQLSYENRVDKIILLSKDTDIKPAIKVARINGIHTVVACFEEYPAGIPKELKVHADTIRKKSFVEFSKTI